MSSGTLPKLVPWRTKNEWELVRTWLFESPYFCDVVKGIARLMVWKSRGKVPAAVEITCAFMECLLADPCSFLFQSPSVPSDPRPDAPESAEPGNGPGPSATPTSNPFQEAGLRRMYASSFIRFVNGLVDLEQRGAYARPVSAIAAEVGLPEWFVDIRHDATHTAMPSLSALRVACVKATEWLYGSYWTAQKQLLDSDIAALLDDLDGYTRLFYNLQPMEEAPELAKELKRLVGDILQRVSPNSVHEMLIPNLLSSLASAGFELHAGVPLHMIPLLEGFAAVWPHFMPLLVEKLMLTLCPEESEGGPGARGMKRKHSDSDLGEDDDDDGADESGEPGQLDASKADQRAVLSSLLQLILRAALDGVSLQKLAFPNNRVASAPALKVARISSALCAALKLSPEPFVVRMSDIPLEMVTYLCLQRLDAGSARILVLLATIKQKALAVACSEEISRASVAQSSAQQPAGGAGSRGRRGKKDKAEERWASVAAGIRRSYERKWSEYSQRLIAVLSVQNLRTQGALSTAIEQVRALCERSSECSFSSGSAAPLSRARAEKAGHPKPALAAISSLVESLDARAADSGGGAGNAGFWREITASQQILKWQSCAIGSLPGNLYPDLSLPLELDGFVDDEDTSAAAPGLRRLVRRPQLASDASEPSALTAEASGLPETKRTRLSAGVVEGEQAAAPVKPPKAAAVKAVKATQPAKAAAPAPVTVAMAIETALKQTTPGGGDGGGGGDRGKGSKGRTGSMLSLF